VLLLVSRLRRRVPLLRPASQPETQHTTGTAGRPREAPASDPTPPTTDRILPEATQFETPRERTERGTLRDGEHPPGVGAEPVDASEAATDIAVGDTYPRAEEQDLLRADATPSAGEPAAEGEPPPPEPGLVLEPSPEAEQQRPAAQVDVAPTQAEQVGSADLGHTKPLAHQVPDEQFQLRSRQPETTPPVGQSIPEGGAESPSEGTETQSRGANVDGDAPRLEEEAVDVDVADPEPSGTEIDGLLQTPAATERKVRPPRRYRPPTGTPSPRPERRPRAAAPAPQTRSLEISVRAVFERGGFCRLSLLPGKDESAGTESVAGNHGELELIPLQDDFYEDVFPPDLGDALRTGVEWQSIGDGPPCRWTLAGRDIYVLAPHEHIAGYVSTTRLVLGENHVVLCTSQRLEDARRAIAESGSPPPATVDERDGLPIGWIGLRGVAPAKSVPQSSGADILNVLRPLPDVAIVLDGGIRIGRNVWLMGYPPAIQLRGDVSTIEDVLIDGVPASQTETRAYVAPGWDRIGEHTVWCAALSRTYHIREGLEEWDGFDAYRWSLGDAAPDGVDSAGSICGPLVRPPAIAGDGAARRIVCAANPVLIGAVPGEIAHARMRRDVRTNDHVSTVRFDPVWALPANPLSCDKRSARVIAIAARPPVRADGRARPGRRREMQMVRAWCTAILDASRKGLAIAPDDAASAVLWAEYKRFAKALWRGSR
jgi:hypothetical protein